MKKIILSLLVMLTAMSASAVRIHTIGDSTMADYDENTTDKRGWCTYLGNFFDAGYSVNNRGKSGSDTRGFYTGAAYWPSVKSQMLAGDYLLIQFAHNDEGTVTNGMDNEEYRAFCITNGITPPTDARGTNPQTTYRDYLRLFIDEARAMGVNPILVGPICRKYFNGNDIRRNGRHDLGDKFSKIEGGVLYENQSVPASDHSMDYVEAMRIVAQEKGVPFLNLTEATRQLYIEYGEALCTSLLFCSGDNTHTATLGANLIARLGAQMLKDSIPALSSHITIPTDITAQPGSLQIGEVYSGVTQTKEILLTGFGLTPASGTITVSATSHLKVSASTSDYQQSISCSYDGGTLFQRISVQALYQEAGEMLDTVTISSGSHVISVPVSATVSSLAGGTTVSAYWSLQDKQTAETAIIEGPIEATMTLNHMVLWNVQSIGDSILARYHNADDSGAKANWPTEEIDENPERYIDFAIKAPTTMDIRVTKIEMNVSSNSTSAMCYHLNYGFGDEMDRVTTLDEKINMANNNVLKEEYMPVLTIQAGETMHIRVLPWHQNTTSGSGKYICLSNVKISGMAFDPTGVEENRKAEKAMLQMIDGRVMIVRGEKIYTISGMEIK